MVKKVLLDYLENKLEQLGRVRVGDIVNNKDDEIKHYINVGKIKFAQEMMEKIKWVENISKKAKSKIE